MTTGTEVAIPEANVVNNALTATEFGAAIEDARRKAKLLADIVNTQKLSTTMRGGTYLHVEAWQTIAEGYGYAAKIEWCRELALGGWEARAVVVDAMGIEVGAAEAECGSEGDNQWVSRPRFQQRSMAQTRATSKALRSRLAWVVVLAGFNPTPYDEMQDEEKDNPGLQVPAAGPATRNQDTRTITEKQRARLFAILKAFPKVTTDVAKEYMSVMFGIEATAELNRTQYDQLVAWIQAGGPPVELPPADADGPEA